MRGRYRHLAFALALAVFAPRPASAYCRTTTNETFEPTVAVPCALDGAPLRWPDASIEFFVSAQASVQVTVEQTRAAAEVAFADWTHADCPLDLATCDGTGGGVPSIAVRYAGTTTAHAAEFRRDRTDQNVILYWDSAWPYPDDGSTLALTTVTFGAESGQIVDADIEVNSNPKVTPLTVDDPRGRAVYDLPSILQHEAGHVLGLAHTQPGHSDATMYTFYQKGSWDMRSLAADDVCGICNAYPPTHIEGGGCTVSTRVTPGARPGPLPAPLSAALGLLVVGAIRKRRRYSQ